MRLVLALLTCVFLVGCGGSLHDKMIGEWKVDLDYFKQSDEYKKMSDMEKGMVDGMAGAMSLTVTEDTVSMMGKSAKYTVKSEEGDTLTLETTDEKGEKETVKIKFDGDTMVLLAPDGKSMPFKRKE